MSRSDIVVVAAAEGAIVAIYIAICAVICAQLLEAGVMPAVLFAAAALVLPRALLSRAT